MKVDRNNKMLRYGPSQTKCLLFNRAGFLDRINGSSPKPAKNGGLPYILFPSTFFQISLTLNLAKLTNPLHFFTL
jgi:hypothetical protein